MKIIIFINSLAGGGAERVAATLANYWARQHWDVVVVTLANRSEDFYVLDAGVKRVEMDLSGNSANFFQGALENLRRVLSLRRIIKQHRPDAILSMMSTPNVLLAAASLGLSDVCTIGSERCYPPHFPLGKMWHALRKLMYGRLHAVVGLTQECATWIRVNTSAQYVPVIPNPIVWPMPKSARGIDPNKHCAAGRKILLAVGRLSPEKGFELLVKVFAMLADKYPDWDLVILGEGPDRQLLQNRIDEFNLTSRVLMPGIAGNVGEWYARADLFVMSSSYEGFPNALAEALAHGLPAISFDCDTGPRDIIRQGIDGLLVPLGNAAELKMALDRFMGDSAARAAFAARAGDAKERFSIHKIAQMWEQLFIELRDAQREPTKARPRATQERMTP